MGTNYYMAVDSCPCCGRSDEKLHIGKSSAGWVFSLNTHPKEGITSLEDWRNAWTNGEIRNEYGERITPREMERIITERKPLGAHPSLSRHTIDDRFCLAHGDGTYDIMCGEFS